MRKTKPAAPIFDQDAQRNAEERQATHGFAPDPEPAPTPAEPYPNEVPHDEPAPPARSARRGHDPELQIIARIDRMLSELEPDAVYRVLAWLNSRKFPGEGQP